jgi:YHS domain-containing protein
MVRLEESMERDPVCGTTIRPGMEVASVNLHGNTYHFCSQECRDEFMKNPTQYSGKEGQQPQQRQA